MDLGESLGNSAGVEQLGKYQLIRKLATGGMAEVFLARAAGPMGFQKTLVVKRILPHYAEDPSFVEMFLAEARIAAELNHPNIVQIFDFGREGGTYFIAMEFIDGPNLGDLQERAQKAGLQMPFHLAAKIISLACDGLAFAHEHRDPETGQPLNLIHRDVSPDNILLSRSGAVKVVDFGIAKATTAKRKGVTKVGLVKGKMAYMSPEQLANEPLDRRSDVFALGIVFYELLTGGQAPFDDRSDALIVQSVMGPEPLWSLSKFRPDAPTPLVRIVAKALEKDVARRYPSCKALQSDLERFIVSVGKTVQGSDLAELVRSLEAYGKPGQSSTLRTSPGAEIPLPTDEAYAEEEAEAFADGEDGRPTDDLQDAWSAVPNSPDFEEELERTTRDGTEPPRLDSQADVYTAPTPYQPEVDPEDAMNRTLRTPSLGAALKRRSLAAQRRRAVFIGGGAGLVVLLVGGVLSLFAAPPPPKPAPKPAFTLRPTPKAPSAEAAAPAGDAVPGAIATGAEAEGAVAAPGGPEGAPEAVASGNSGDDAGVATEPGAAAQGTEVAQAVPATDPSPSAVPSQPDPAPVGEKPEEKQEAPPAEPKVTATPAKATRAFSLRPASSRKAAEAKAAEKPPEPKSSDSASTSDEAPRTEPVKVASKPSEGARGQAQLDIRVRPYAQVYLDGTLLGETPLAPVMATPGKHRLRLVNEKLGKDTTVELVVKANGDNVFKYDLKEAP